MKTLDQLQAELLQIICLRPIPCELYKHFKFESYCAVQTLIANGLAKNDGKTVRATYDGQMAYAAPEWRQAVQS